MIRAPIERIFTRCGEHRYVLDVADLCIVLDLERVHRDRFGALRGELTVKSDLPGAATIEGTLWSGEILLSDNRGRPEILRTLTSRAKAKGLDWSLLVDELAIYVREAERRGQPAVLLRDVPRPPAEDVLTVQGVRLPVRHPSILFGDGASGKSYLALFLAGQIHKAGHRVGLFDWELDAADHRDRLHRLYGDEMPGLVYVRCARPLVHEVDRLARIIHEHQLDYAILDSIGFACSGPPEAAEVATEYLRALRSLGIGTLSLAHISKSGDAAEHRPFGSTFWHAGARMTWFAKADSTPGTSAFTLGLFNRKNNLGPPWPAVGFDVDFAGDRTTFARVDLASVDALAGKLTTYERVIASLRSGPRTIAALAEALDAKPDTIEKSLKRWIAKGRLVRLDAQNGTPTRYGLADLRRVK